MTDRAKRDIRLLFAGDVVPVQPDEWVWAQSHRQALSGAIQGEIEGSDAFIINLECPLTQSSHEFSKYGPSLKSPALVAEILAQMGVTAVSLANNHILDYGQEGVCDTRRALEENQLRYFGVGPTAEQACEPFFLARADCRVGILAYAEHEFNWQGDDTWTTGLINPAANILQIMRVARQCDKLVVFTHCGPEYCHYPSPRMVQLFHAMVDAGAHAVVNSHSHAVMGIEQVGGASICYGLGNFWFPRQGRDGEWNVGLMVRLHLGLSGVTADPIIIRYVPQVGIVPFGGPAAAELLRQKSESLKDKAFLDRQWHEYCLRQRKRLLRSVIKGALAMVPALGYRALFKHGPVKAGGRFLRAVNLYRGLVTCENHTEVLSTILDQMRKGAP